MSGTPEGEEGILVRGDAGTADLGRLVAEMTRPGDLWLVTGEVGAGKSTLVRAALRALGVAGPVPSPTFTIGRSYDEPGQRMPVSHLDLYRLGDPGEEDPGLLDEYVGPDLAAFVEWPGGSAAGLAAMATRVGRVAIEHVDPESRRVLITEPY